MLPDRIIQSSSAVLKHLILKITQERDNSTEITNLKSKINKKLLYLGPYSGSLKSGSGTSRVWCEQQDKTSKQRQVLEEND